MDKSACNSQRKKNGSTSLHGDRNKKKKKKRTKKTGKAESKHKKADFNPDMNNYQLKEVCRKDDQT